MVKHTPEMVEARFSPMFPPCFPFDVPSKIRKTGHQGNKGETILAMAGGTVVLFYSSYFLILLSSATGPQNNGLLMPLVVSDW